MTSPTATHAHVSYDGDLVEAVTARLDLRIPNAEGLDAVARAFDAAAGHPFEAVCEIATAVGKTYLAAGLVDYLSAQGVRNILIVTPGRTVLTKTIDNFTAGHSKAVPGMESDHLLVTADNFNTSATRAAFDDDTRTKLFVFTVQSLIKPPKDLARKTREYQEWLGETFYGYLSGLDDLVIIGDEHHVYAEAAEAFSAAITDLSPMAVIGLTATAAATQKNKIIYDYPLAKALRDRLVKTPVLVGRTDDHKDLVAQLSDGLALLSAKQKTADTYRAAHGGKQVNAVMLIVAERIDQANSVAEILARPALLGDAASAQVLVIHSQSDDDALAQLASVEEPTSAVRVIISVSMLKEGWDVKNIFVIASLRPSVSDTLTEQTLGRGLRLPYGAHTGVELLDTVEVLAHDRYETLLASAGILIRGITNVRVIEAPTSGPTLGRAEAPTDGAVGVAPVDVRFPAETVVVTYGGSTSSTTTPGSLAGSVDDAAPTLPGMANDQPPAGFIITSVDARINQAATSADSALPVPAIPERPVSLPKVTRTMGVANFSLSDIDDAVFTDIGHKVAGAHTAKLDRKVLDVVEDGAGGYTLVPRQGEAIDAAVVSLPLGGMREHLISAILVLDFVPNTPNARNGAARLVDAAIAGAGGESQLETYHEAATKLVLSTLRKRFRAAAPVESQDITVEVFAPGRTTHRRREPNRYGAFSTEVAYEGWVRSTHPYNWFDSEPERKLANLLDADLGNDGVRVWSRILRGEAPIAWSGGMYTPDFYAQVGEVHYLIEVKANRDMEDAEVLAKKEEARRLARAVTDEGDHGTWGYLLISQQALDTAKNVGDLLRIAAT